MPNVNSWGKLSPEQRYNYGVYVVVSVLAAVVVFQNFEYKCLENSIPAKVSQGKKSDSISAALWRGNSIFWQTRYLRKMDSDHIEDSIMKQKFEELKHEKN